MTGGEVGSSWGGAVALQCLREGLRPDRILLLAPALAVKGALSARQEHC